MTSYLRDRQQVQDKRFDIWQSFDRCQKTNDLIGSRKQQP